MAQFKDKITKAISVDVLDISFITALYIISALSHSCSLVMKTNRL